MLLCVGQSRAPAAAGLQAVMPVTKLVPCAGGQGPACGADGDAASADSEAGLDEALENSVDEVCGAARPAATADAAARAPPGLPAAAHPQGARSPAAERVLRPSDIYAYMRVPYFSGTIARWCTIPGADLRTLAHKFVVDQQSYGEKTIFAGKGEGEVRSCSSECSVFEFSPYSALLRFVGAFVPSFAHRRRCWPRCRR